MCKRETSTGCLLHTPSWGPGPQPRHVPWPGIEPVTFRFTGQHSIHWATPARAIFIVYYSCACIKRNVSAKYSSKGVSKLLCIQRLLFYITFWWNLIDMCDFPHKISLGHQGWCHTQSLKDHSTIVSRIVVHDTDLQAVSFHAGFLGLTIRFQERHLKPISCRYLQLCPITITICKMSSIIRGALTPKMLKCKKKFIYI